MCSTACWDMSCTRCAINGVPAQMLLWEMKDPLLSWSTMCTVIICFLIRQLVKCLIALWNSKNCSSGKSTFFSVVWWRCCSPDFSTSQLFMLLVNQLVWKLERGWGWMCLCWGYDRGRVITISVFFNHHYCVRETLQFYDYSQLSTVWQRATEILTFCL